tara:strand:- start:229 stop:1632 length:1404 start_codon:yes stop_codon:yes gene_type:complete
MELIPSLANLRLADVVPAAPVGVVDGGVKKRWRQMLPRALAMQEQEKAKREAEREAELEAEERDALTRGPFPSPPTPSGKLAVLWYPPSGRLYGVDGVTYEQGFDAFLSGQAFGNTAMNSITWSSELAKMLKTQVFNSQQQSTAPKRSGTSNAYHKLPPADARYVTAFAGHPADEHVGLRLELSNTRSANLQWREAYNSLHAAAADVGPPVYAVGRVNGRLAMLMRAGVENLHEELRRVEEGGTRGGRRVDTSPDMETEGAWIDVPYCNKLSEQIAALIHRTGEVGLVLADVTTVNMVVMPPGGTVGGDDSHPVVRMIDFDPAHSWMLSHSLASSDCVQFLNGMWFMCVLGCNYRLVAGMVTEKLRANLEALEVPSILEDPRNDKGALCVHVLRHSHSYKKGGPIVQRLMKDLMRHLGMWKSVGNKESCDAILRGLDDKKALVPQVWERVVEIAKASAAEVEALRTP